jgi:regulator of sigma E protease
MILSLMYLALSLFGLGLLIFVHEWGHYIVGLKMGMKVETFSIGFGKPIKSWKAQNGVMFQIGSVPFGGFVKFKGLDGDRSSSDGFYSVPFYKRIFVAFAGPLANLILAFLVFTIIFLCGGRHIDFQEKNPFVGLIKQGGKVFALGLREGDKIEKVNGKPYRAFQDFMVEKLTSKAPLRIEGMHFPFYTEKSFDIKLQEGGFYPADFLLFKEVPKIIPEEMAYLKKQGLQAGDRLLSLNGMPVFSRSALITQLQMPSCLLHIQREGKLLPVKIQKLRFSDIKLTRLQEGEVTDWMHQAGLKQLKYFIPYDLTNDLFVEGTCEFLNEEAAWQMPAAVDTLNPLEQTLQKGDKIVACNGKKITRPSELVAILDKDVFHVVAQKRELKKLDIKEAIDEFWAPYLSQDYKELMANPDLLAQGQFFSFEIPAIKLEMLKLTEAEKVRQDKILQDNLEAINKIKDPKLKAQALKELEQEQKRFMIGAKFSDQLIKFNPNPFFELYDACMMTFKTIGGLVKGGLSPKQLSGPVAIVGVMQQGAQKSVIDGLYYFAVISINLGLFNLLPLPVLDGGHILFALYEGIFRRPVPQKMMERLTLIFVVILVSLILYATYNDILRFIRGLF